MLLGHPQSGMKSCMAGDFVGTYTLGAGVSMVVRELGMAHGTWQVETWMGCVGMHL